MIKNLFIRYKSMILYVLFGGFTTLVNMGAYHLTFNMMGIPNVPSTIIAWLLAVIFAFLTNKQWVFDSRSWKADVLIREALAFFSARIATGLLDIVIMYAAVDVMHWNGLIWKLISNVIVIVLNYVASKLFIFKKNGDENREEKNLQGKQEK